MRKLPVAFYQLGIIGQHLGHTWSPLLHTELLRLLGLQGVYEVYPTEPEGLAARLTALAQAGVVGLNITVPYKQAVQPYMAELTPQAQAIGAINTLGWRDELAGWVGHNTDADGWWASLPTALQVRLGQPESHVLMLGAGGAAKAMLYKLAQHGVGQVTLAVRNPAKAQVQLAEWWLSLQPNGTPLAFCTLPPSDASDAHFTQACAKADALINTTPLGMLPNTEGLPMPEVSLNACKPNVWLVDAVYNPRPTRWLTLGQARGFATVDGLGMLLYQAQLALAWWTNTPPEAFATHWEEALRDVCPVGLSTLL